ncbi:MAG: hypothetical protein IPP60_12450 [Sphingobacteriales bacterium]|nr:hypothetical protein [Sphingobacteriales bacterium]
MDIQATISKLQSDIKLTSGFISSLEEHTEYWLNAAKANGDSKYPWRKYHQLKDDMARVVEMQKISKSMYKLMCTIQKQMPNGSISMAQIREM